ncbi:MAG: hypothetical protein ACE5D0_00400 [Fidelibacterota bacterium]
MNFRLPLAGFMFFLSISYALENNLDSLSKGLQHLQYKKIDVTLTQFQYGERYYSKISVSFIDTSSYLVTSNEQDIFVSDRKVKTWNKVTNQLIIDNKIEGDKDIFSLLTGDLNGVILQNKRNENGIITFGYFIKDYGLKGILKVEELTWHLREIEIEYDQDNTVQLTIDNWQFLPENISFSDFGKKANEVIDLNE